MTDFNDIQQLWNKQDASTGKAQQPEELIRLAEKNNNVIKAKHRWTIGILSLTVFLLAWYFVSYSDFTINRFFLGLSLMIFSLLLRIAVEYMSYRNFQKIDIRADFKTYTARVTKFYSTRKKIHFVITPLMLLTYITGFTLLLPIFRQILSTGFYIYIIVSGALFFIDFAWFMVKQIKKEMLLLHFLRNVKVDDNR